MIANYKVDCAPPSIGTKSYADKLIYRDFVRAEDGTTVRIERFGAGCDRCIDRNFSNSASRFGSRFAAGRKFSDKADHGFDTLPGRQASRAESACDSLATKRQRIIIVSVYLPIGSSSGVAAQFVALVVASEGVK
jgi:hypothetical protein